MSELEEQIRNRRRKRDELLAKGVDPYPRRFEHDLEPTGVQAQYGELSGEELEMNLVELAVPGRIKGLRSMGKVVFADLSDGASKIQLFMKKNRLPEETWELINDLDLGDYVGARGRLVRTRTGELSLAVESLILLAKSLRPLPEKWHGLTDIETRYRLRYLDLISNPESRRVFEIRAAIVREMRAFLDGRGFLEVETPMMQSVAGGAAARPFKTHHNALDIDLYLRIAPELYLKRLLVGGLHRVYEINRNFRNEGISVRHNPEFTMLEFYWAYVDYRALMDFTEEMIVGLAESILGKSSLTWQEETLDLSSPWARYSVREAIQHFEGIEESELETKADLIRELEKREIDYPEASSYGHLLMTLFDETVEPHLRQPTFITGLPVEVSPLAKTDPEDERFTERYELFIGGMEIANAFSELNDPDVQAERFRQQLQAREAGEQETHAFDHDYVLALEHGMPPAGGEGIGIDRLAMLFTDSGSIRDVILFPLLRPQVAEEE